MTMTVRNPDVLWREEEESRDRALAGLCEGGDVEELGTSLLLLDGRILSLNLVGTEIWKLCDGRSEEEIVAELAESFEVSREELAADVRAFLAELATQGFISHVD